MGSSRDDDVTGVEQLFYLRVKENDRKWHSSWEMINNIKSVNTERTRLLQILKSNKNPISKQ